jgi:hypothetical protein
MKSGSGFPETRAHFSPTIIEVVYSRDGTPAKAKGNFLTLAER